MPTDNTDQVKLEILAGAILDFLSVLDLQARAWIVQRHPEIEVAIMTVENALKEFHCENAADSAWYRAWGEMRKNGKGWLDDAKAECPR
jgi:hypothetical protein